MEDKKRAYISDHDRDLLSRNSKLLGLGSMEAKEVFAMTMALGMDAPQKLPSPNTSWIRSESFDTSNRAIIAALRLGADDINDDTINEHANYNDCITYANMCSYTGFRRLEQKIEEANGNNDELVAELMIELDRLYRKNVEQV